MALTGTFHADFAAFYTAVIKAEKHLTDMSAGADKAGERLNRMIDTFSGRKVIQEATLMSEAVERIGGTSKLTETEFARLGVTAGEAVAKMKAMGIDVPPGLQKIANETKAVTGAHGSLLDSVKSVALGFAAMFTARAAISFVKDIVAEASALKDLSQQTHINVEELQALGGSMSEFGVDADALGKALYTLSRKVAGDDASVARGLHLMGMSLADVRGQQGEELFLSIMRGLSTLQGGLRDTAAAEIFGSRLGMSMAGASEGIETALADTKRLSSFMTTDAVDSMDKYDESIKRASRSLSAMAANLIGPVAGGLNDFIAVGEKVGFVTALWARLKDSMSGGLGPGAGGTAFATLAADIAAATRNIQENTKATTDNAAGHRATVVALTEEQRHTAFLSALQRDAGAALTAEQMRNLAMLKAAGQLNAQNAEGIGVNAAQYERYTKAIQLATTAQEKATEEQEKYAKAAGNLQDLLAGPQGIIPSVAAAASEFLKLGATQADVATAFFLSAGQVKALATELAKTTAVAVAHKAAMEKAILSELNAQIQLNAAQGLNAVGALKAQASAAETLRQGLDDLQRTKLVGVSQQAQIQVLQDAYTRSLYDEAVAQDKANAATVAALKGLRDVPAATGPAADGILSIGAAAQQTAGSLFSMSAELYNSIRAAQLFDDLSGRSGNAILFGPTGVSTPTSRRSTAATAISLSGGGGSSSVTSSPVTVNMNGMLLSSDPGARQQLAAEIDRAVTDSLRRQGVRMGA